MGIGYYVAASKKKDAIKFFREWAEEYLDEGDLYSFDEGDVKALSADEMLANQFTEGRTISFADRLNNLIQDDEDFPLLFASEDI